jgi:HlyD family secretion protein
VSSNSKRSAGAWASRWALILVAIGLAFVGGRRALLGPVVSCVQPHRGPLVQRVVLTGRVITPGKTQIGTITLGTVSSVLVDAGSHVTQGQLLVRLNDSEQQAAVAQARAGIALSLAQLGQVRQISDRVATATLAEARVNLDQSRRELQRFEQLAQTGAISPQSIDSARDAVTAAASRLAGAEARSIGAKGAESQVAGARIAEARAALSLAEARLAQTALYAPADGTILERQVEPGDLVQPGKVLLVLARDGNLRLEAQSDEKNLVWFRLGLTAQVVADAMPEQPFPAVLSWISPAVDVDRGTVDVRFELAQPVPGLKPDMTVSVNLEITRRPQALLLPLSAVRDNSSDRPWVLALDGQRTRRVPVVLGSRGTDQVEVLSGVDERSVLVDQMGIAEGARVRAKTNG